MKEARTKWKLFGLKKRTEKKIKGQRRGKEKKEKREGSEKDRSMAGKIDRVEDRRVKISKENGLQRRIEMKDCYDEEPADYITEKTGQRIEGM